jgi:hypothetical protein
VNCAMRATRHDGHIVHIMQLAQAQTRLFAQRWHICARPMHDLRRHANTLTQLGGYVDGFAYVYSVPISMAMQTAA